MNSTICFNVSSVLTHTLVAIKPEVIESYYNIISEIMFKQLCHKVRYIKYFEYCKITIPRPI